MSRSRISKEKMKEEILRCGRDPIYFIRHYVKISHAERGLIPFALYPYQEDLLKDFRLNRFSIILKARQLGISTLVSAYAAWLLLFHRSKTVLVVATKFKVAVNIVKKVKAIVEDLPPWIKSIAEIKINNESSFELNNRSWIKASATSEDAGRSEALSLLIVDEAAHIAGFEGIWTALYPTLSTGGACIALSSPNGVGNWFYDTYMGALKQQNDFKDTELLWDVHPDRDEEWFKKETKNMTKRQIAQELLCSFVLSGKTVIEPEDIQRMEASILKPLRRSGFDRNYWVWEEYQADSSYYIVADVARGDGADNSVFLIFKLETMELVAEYQGKVTPDILADMLYQVGHEYGKSLVVVENNTVGYAVLQKLLTLEYPNIYHSTREHEFVEQHVAEFKSGVVAGFSNTSKTRPLLIAKLEEYVRNKVITSHSLRLLDELRTFIWNGTRPEAQRNKNDDLVMACAIACWIKDTVYCDHTRGAEQKKTLLLNMVKSSRTINTTIPGMVGHGSNKSLEDIEKKYKKFAWMITKG